MIGSMWLGEESIFEKAVKPKTYLIMFDQPEKETVSWYNTTMYILFFCYTLRKKNKTHCT